MAHPMIKYLSYLSRHKWYVLCECAKRGQLWRGLIHDWSKFRPSEFVPYYRHFYGQAQQGKDENGYYKSADSGDPDFDYAWLLHVSRNKHHWQFWIMPDEDSQGNPTDVKIYEVPLKYRKEMLSDWIGAGKAQGSKGIEYWWEKNRSKLLLGPETRAWLSREITRIAMQKGVVGTGYSNASLWDDLEDLEAKEQAEWDGHD